MLLTFAAVVLAVVAAVMGQGCDPYLKYPQHSMCIYQEKACQTGLTLIRKWQITNGQLFLLFKQCTNHTKIRNLDLPHLWCLLQNKVVWPLPGSGALSAADKQELVDVHNKVRQDVVDGKIQGAPAAVSMKTMVWQYYYYLNYN